MFKSKPLRRMIREVKSDIETFGFLKALPYIFIYPITDTFSRLKERIGRTLAFARIAWLHYDFDSAYMWHIMAFKLKRIEKCLINGHAIQEEADMAALRETIIICERLFSEDYDSKYHEAHNAKWGDLPEFGTEPSDVDNKGKVLTYRVIFKDRPKVTNETEKEQERKEFLECFNKGEQDRLADMDRLAFLLKTHSRQWWD